MRVPTIHLNGTGRETLLVQLENAGSALREALEALREASPNGRDYYPQGDGAGTEALREHMTRLERVKSVLTEITELHEKVTEA